MNVEEEEEEMSPDAVRWQPDTGTHPRNMSSAQFEEWLIERVKATRKKLADERRRRESAPSQDSL